MKAAKLTPEQYRAKRCMEALKDIARPGTVPDLVEAAQIVRNRFVYGSPDELKAALECMFEALGKVEAK